MERGRGFTLRIFLFLILCFLFCSFVFRRRNFAKALVITRCSTTPKRTCWCTAGATRPSPFTVRSPSPALHALPQNFGSLRARVACLCVRTPACFRINLSGRLLFARYRGRVFRTWCQDSDPTRGQWTEIVITVFRPKSAHSKTERRRVH